MYITKAGVFNTRDHAAMIEENLRRMIRLADEVFNTREDPEQISVTEEVMARLHGLHPATMMEERDVQGPIAWTLVMPTTKEVMEQFVGMQISEKELLDLTPSGVRYDALYLCSALVLPEHRRRGLARSLLCRAVEEIRKDHPIDFLFCWPFSPEGKTLASAVAATCRLPLRERSAAHR
jgi:ribosomal protein S18 acetylase RimI-like enzyme